MRDTLKPKCVKCRKKPVQQTYFCGDCWYPGIIEDWSKYQMQLEEGYRRITAQIKSDGPKNRRS